MNELFIIAIVIAFMVVAIAIYKNKDIPESISEIAYIIPRPIFSIWMAIIAVFLAPTLVEHLNYLGFVSIVSLIGVAISSLYKTLQRTFHYICGWIAGVSLLLITYLCCPYMLLLWLFYAFVTSKYVFWIEVFIFIQAILSIISVQ